MLHLFPLRLLVNSAQFKLVSADFFLNFASVIHQKPNSYLSCLRLHLLLMGILSPFAFFFQRAQSRLQTRICQHPVEPLYTLKESLNAYRNVCASFKTGLFTNISFISSRKGHYSLLWLVNRVEFVSWSGTFSYVTMFGHVE